MGHRHRVNKYVIIGMPSAKHSGGGCAHVAESRRGGRTHACEARHRHAWACNVLRLRWSDVHSAGSCSDVARNPHCSNSSPLVQRHWAVVSDSTSALALQYTERRACNKMHSVARDSARNFHAEFLRRGFINYNRSGTVSQATVPPHLKRAMPCKRNRARTGAGPTPSSSMPCQLGSEIPYTERERRIPREN